MDIVTLCPLRSGSVVWQPRRGTWALTVVSKATYRLAPAEAQLVEEQEPPNEEESHWNDDPARSMYAPSDLVPFKPRADVMLVGHAFAPGGAPVQSLVARLGVLVRAASPAEGESPNLSRSMSASSVDHPRTARIDKAIEVFAERVLKQDELREGAPFVKMPLWYERAACGSDMSNPVGVRREGHGVVRMPNLQPPGATSASPAAQIGSIGFGPIASSWLPRMNRLGRHAGVWQHEGWQTRPFPDDFDYSYFNAAPPDQQIELLREDTMIGLDNLHPEHARLVTRLPGVRPRVMVERRGTAFELAMTADTLWIDTDRGLCTLTWRGRLGLDQAGDAGRVVVTMVGPERRQAAAPAQGDRSAREAQPIDDRGNRPDAPSFRRPSTITSVDAVKSADVVKAAALPFGRTTMSGMGPTTPPVSAPPMSVPSTPISAPAPISPSAAAVGEMTIPATAPLTGAAILGSMSNHSPWAAASPAPMSAPMSAPAPVAAPIAVPMSAPVPVASPIAVPMSAAAPVPSPIAVPAAAPAFVPSALAASNAAVSAEPRPGASARPAGAGPLTESRELIDLLWFDPACVKRLRAQPCFEPVLDALDEEPADKDLEASMSDEEAEVKEDRTAVFQVLATGSALGGSELEQAFWGAVRKDGKFVPPLVLLGGELHLQFDEIETLKATVTLASPYAAADKKLKEAVDAAAAALQEPELEVASGIPDSLLARIREAFAQTQRTLPADWLDTQAKRVLVRKRCYQKRPVLGADAIRSLFRPSGSDAPLPAYLPDTLASRLPLFPSFSARLLAEVHVQQDQDEAHPSALRAVALGRVGFAVRR